MTQIALPDYGVDSYMNTHEGYAWRGPIVQLDISISEVESHARRRQTYKRNIAENNKRVDTHNTPLVTEMTGLLGEFVVAQYYSDILQEDIQVNLDHLSGGDNGIDFYNLNGHSVDVKFISFPSGDLIFPSLLNFKADIAMLVVPVCKEYHGFLKDEHPVFRIAGWETKEAFRSDHIYHSRLDEDGMERASKTWWGYGKTQTAIPRSCPKCDYHANRMRPIKMPK